MKTKPLFHRQLPVEGIYLASLAQMLLLVLTVVPVLHPSFKVADRTLYSA